MKHKYCSDSWSISSNCWWDPSTLYIAVSILKNCLETALFLLCSIWNKASLWISREELNSTHYEDPSCLKRSRGRGQIEHFLPNFSTQSRLQASWLMWVITSGFSAVDKVFIRWQIVTLKYSCLGWLRPKWTSMWESQIGMQMGRREPTLSLPQPLILQGRNFKK